MSSGNQEIEQEHLLYNLLHQDDSLILKMIEKMEIQKEHFLNRINEALNARVKVQGGNPYIGQYLNKVLVSAEDEAKAMGGRVCLRGAPVFVHAAESKPQHEARFLRVRHHQRALSPGSEHGPGATSG